MCWDFNSFRRVELTAVGGLCIYWSQVPTIAWNPHIVKTCPQRMYIQRKKYNFKYRISKQYDRALRHALVNLFRAFLPPRRQHQVPSFCNTRFEIAKVIREFFSEFAARHRCSDECIVSFTYCLAHTLNFVVGMRKEVQKLLRGQFRCCIKMPSKKSQL